MRLWNGAFRTFKIQMKYEYVRITSTVCLPIPDATESSVLGELSMFGTLYIRAVCCFGC